MANMALPSSIDGLFWPKAILLLVAPLADTVPRTKLAAVFLPGMRRTVAMTVSVPEPPEQVISGSASELLSHSFWNSHIRDPFMLVGLVIPSASAHPAVAQATVAVAPMTITTQSSVSPLR